MTITVQIPTEPSYYGSTCTSEQVDIIATRLESMLRNQFDDHHITFERTPTPSRSGVRCLEDSDLAEEVADWIAENWTAAL